MVIDPPNRELTLDSPKVVRALRRKDYMPLMQHVMRHEYFREAKVRYPGGVIIKNSKDIIGFKKVYSRIKNDEGSYRPYRKAQSLVAVLLIPDGAYIRAPHPDSRLLRNDWRPISLKFRTDHAYVIGLLAINPKKRVSHRVAYAGHGGLDFKYPVGKWIAPDASWGATKSKNGYNFSNQSGEECAAGIHFFHTFKEAARW